MSEVNVVTRAALLPVEWQETIIGFVSEHAALEHKRLERMRCLVTCIGMIKLGVVESRYTPKTLSDYVKYSLDNARIDNMEPVMFFYDMYNHYKRIIPRHKRRFLIQVFLRLALAFDGSLQGDADFHYDGTYPYTLGTCWVTVNSSNYNVVDDEGEDGEDLNWLYGDESSVEDMGIAIMLESSDDETDAEM